MLATVALCALAGAEGAPGTTVTKIDASTRGDALGVGERTESPAIPAATNILGVQWRGDPEARLAVETRAADGTWRTTATIGHADGGADPNSAEARGAAGRMAGRTASAPISVRGADEVRVRVTDGTISDVRIVAVAPTLPVREVPVQQGLVGGGVVAVLIAGALAIPRRRLIGAVGVVAMGGAMLAAVPARTPSADAAVPTAPGIISRAQWGANENLRLTACPDGPNYSAPTLAVVHHTDTSNGDSPAQSFATVRSIYEYYVSGRGYCDHGYNFLIDRYGQIFEGRFGGTDKGVIGAHATSFNTGTIGVALIGTFTSQGPPSPMVNSLIRLLQWKMTIHVIDPSVPVPTHGTFVDAVIGHRDAGAISGDGTACPGNVGYTLLPSVRAWLRATVPVGQPWSNVEVVRQTPGAVRMAGWALDPETSDPIDVHTYVDANGVRNVADLERPDVGAIYPDRGTAHGFDITSVVPPGTHSVCNYAISVGKGNNELMRCFTTSGRPIGNFEAVGREPGWIAVAGWTLDPDTADPILLDITVDGRYIHTTGAVAPRPDIDAAFPGYGAPHGFWARVPVTPGLHTVCVFGISVLADPSTPLGCKVA
jgi:hypothetical protein